MRVRRFLGWPAGIRMTEDSETPAACEPGRDPRTRDPGLWRVNGWTARAIKNIDDERWRSK